MADASIGRTWFVLALALVLTAGSAPSFALEAGEDEEQEGQQTQEQAEQEGDDDDEDGEEPAEKFLDEIYVTAQKRVQSVIEVPVSMTTIDQEDLEVFTSGGADIKTLSGRVPSLVIESSFGKAFPRFYIRGLGNTDFDLNASQPVSMVYDEVVLENPILKGMPLFDVERVEVLRGPQGTLFGRNTPAGVVKFDSVKPFAARESYVRASYGTFDTIDVKAAINGKLTDTISARLSGVIQTRSDWIDNEHTGEDDALGSDETGALRLQFLFEPTENFNALLNLHAWEVDGTARVFRANIIKPGTNDLTSDFDQDEVFHDGQNFQDIDSQGASLRFDYDLGGSVLTSITSFETLDMLSGADIDGGFGFGFIGLPNGPGFIPFPSETADGIPDLDQVTQEIRIASEGEQRFGWLFGAFYFDEDLSAETFSFDSITPGNPVNGFATQEQETESYALFGSINYLPNDRWDLGAGIRFSTDEKEFSAERIIPVFPALTPTIRPVTANTDEDNVSWDASAKYQISEQTNVYGRVATSFRAPSIQGRILFAPDASFGLDPDTDGVSVADEEEILSFEVGSKTELLNRKLRLGLGVFQYEVDGQQLTAVGGGLNLNTLINADTEGYGFELDVEWAPTAAFQVTMGVSNNQTEIKDDIRVELCSGGCTITDPIVGGRARIQGNSLPHAPEWIFNGIIDYRKPAGEGILVASVDWAYGDERSFFLYESEEFNADSFELGARIGFTFAEAKYEVAAYARNLTDEEILQGGIDFNNLTGMMNDPRTIGIELIGRW